MQILETEEGWALEHAGRLPIAIEGESYFTDRALLVAAIEKRDMHVWEDGSVNKRPQPMFDDEPSDSSGAPPSEDPPTDPNAQPNDPDPNPIAPEPVTPKPDDLADGGVLPGGTHHEIPDDSGCILRPEAVEALGGKAVVEKVNEPAKPKRSRKPKTTSASETVARGRPRVYSPEEAKKRRREKARIAAANRTAEQKAAASERARKWRENNPDKVKAVREKSMKKRAERYDQDPEFRMQFNEYQRQYKREKRGTEKS